MFLQPLNLTFLQAQQGSNMGEGIGLFPVVAQIQNTLFSRPELTQMTMQPVIGFFYSRCVITTDQIEKRL